MTAVVAPPATELAELLRSMAGIAGCSITAAAIGR